jgi:hypothetical protein
MSLDIILSISSKINSLAVGKVENIIKTPFLERKTS